VKHSSRSTPDDIDALRCPDVIGEVDRSAERGFTTRRSTWRPGDVERMMTPTVDCMVGLRPVRSCCSPSLTNPVVSIQSLTVTVRPERTPAADERFVATARSRTAASSRSTTAPRSSRRKAVRRVPSACLPLVAAGLPPAMHPSSSTCTTGFLQMRSQSRDVPSPAPEGDRHFSERAGAHNRGAERSDPSHRTGPLLEVDP
jgi:hypothetical protein